MFRRITCHHQEASHQDSKHNEYNVGTTWKYYDTRKGEFVGVLYNKFKMHGINSVKVVYKVSQMNSTLEQNTGDVTWIRILLSVPCRHPQARRFYAHRSRLSLQQFPAHYLFKHCRPLRQFVIINISEWWGELPSVEGGGSKPPKCVTILFSQRKCYFHKENAVLKAF